MNPPGTTFFDVRAQTKHPAGTYGRPQRGKKSIYVVPPSADACKLVLTDPAASDYGDPASVFSFHATVYGKHRLQPALSVHTVSFFQRAQLNVTADTASNYDGYGVDTEARTSLEHEGVYFYGEEDEDCGPVTVEIGIDGGAAKRRNRFVGGARQPRDPVIPVNRTYGASAPDWGKATGLDEQMVLGQFCLTHLHRVYDFF